VLALARNGIAAADQADVRQDLQRLYDRASAASVAARTVADLDTIHDWLDTADCVYADAGQPQRTWSQMRTYAAEGLRTRLKSMTNEIIALDVQDAEATATTRVRGVASITDSEGRFGVKGAMHDVETTATVRDVWVRTAAGWRRRSHDKTVANQVTAIDGKPIK
jgi:hypothetical protein